MLTKIGAAAPAGDAVDLLLECHARIRSFLALAARIAAEGVPGDPGVADAAARVRRYFTEALPLHARDEEESIVPRLRGRDPAVDAALAVMSREHGEHDRPLGALLAACDALAEDPARLAGLAGGLAAAAAELTAHFDRHLAGEEDVILPAMRRLLGPAADAEIVAEIRGRRAPASGDARAAPPAPLPAP